MRVDGNTRWPSALEIAKVKAEAFGKGLVEDQTDLAKQYKLPTEENEQPTFLVNGGSSAFRYRGVVIKLQASSNKRLHLKDMEAGHAVHTLWALGKDELTPEIVEEVVLRTSVPDVRRKLILAKSWMPDWLARSFRTERYPVR